MLRACCLAAVTVLLGTACVNNSIDLESMTDADADSASASTTGDGGSTAITSTTRPSTVPVTTSVDGTASDTADIRIDVSGGSSEPAVLLLAIDTVLSPGLPLQGIVWLVRQPAGTVDLELQWLSLDVGSTTEPRELVGDIYSYEGIPVGEDGSFNWDTGVILVPGEANPITGSDITVSASAQVVPDGDPFCGRVGGMVTSPLNAPLDGSTHAMTQVDDVMSLPLDVVFACP